MSNTNNERDATPPHSLKCTLGIFVQYNLTDGKYLEPLEELEERILRGLNHTGQAQELFTGADLGEQTYGPINRIEPSPFYGLRQHGNVVYVLSVREIPARHLAAHLGAYRWLGLGSVSELMAGKEQDTYHVVTIDARTRVSEGEIARFEKSLRNVVNQLDTLQ